MSTATNSVAHLINALVFGSGTDKNDKDYKIQKRNTELVILLGPNTVFPFELFQQK